MAITAADVALWRALREMEAIPSAPAVVEIGQANWYGDCAPPAGRDTSTREGSYAAARAFWEETFGAGCALAAIDLHGPPGALRHDLNEPLPILPSDSGYDVLVNTGTAEHIFDQGAFWRNCHALTRPGGLMVHGLPWTGWINHGLYNYQPGFVLDLASANGYDVLLLWATSISPLEVRPVFKEGDAHHRLVLDPHRDTMLHVAFRKGSEAPFRSPMQAAYADAPDDDGTGGWRSVPGWLSPAEGRALQALAAGKRVLELGAWKGRSTCCLAEVARLVLSVDTFQGDLGTGEADTFGEWSANVDAQGHTAKVSVIQGRFADVVTMVTKAAYELAFVDGAHSADGTEEACRLALACLSPGGTVALHDWHMHNVRKGAARCGLTAPDGTAASLAWFVR